MNVLRKAALSLQVLATCSLLAACATDQGPAKVAVQRVEVPVALPCSVDPGPDPAFADTPEAIRQAADIFERAKLLLAGRAQRDARINELKAASAGCR